MKALSANLRRVLQMEQKPWRLVVAGTAPARQARIGEIFRDYDARITLTRVDSLARLLEKNLDPVDLLICDVRLRDASIDKVLEEALLLRPDLPVIVLAEASQAEQVEAAALAVTLGAYDYLAVAEDDVSTLPQLVDKCLAIHAVRMENARLQVQLTSTLIQLKSRNQQLQSLVQELETIAATDSLTGIANRRSLTDALQQRHAAAVRDNRDLALLMIDMDGFKELNDSAGHAAGDRVLQLTAQVLKANCRASDVPGRIGGDEFVLVMPETALPEARAAAERIQSNFATAFDQFCQEIKFTGRVSMSVGLATRAHCPSATADQLLGHADNALYSAKQAGKHRVVIHGEG